MIAWKLIDRFPNYEVSNFGDVRRVVGGQGAKAGRVLKWHLHTSSGYPDVRLVQDGKTVSVPVHRLVACAFLGPRPDGMQVRHLDGDKMNARVKNLTYGSAQQNGQDKVSHGRSSKGVKNPKCKLTENQVGYIHDVLKGSMSADEVAEIFSLNTSTVYRIWSGKYWGHITNPSNRHVERAAL
jgi:hypothetical protein